MYSHAEKIYLGNGSADLCEAVLFPPKSLNRYFWLSTVSIIVLCYLLLEHKKAQFCQHVEETLNLFSMVRSSSVLAILSSLAIIATTASGAVTTSLENCLQKISGLEVVVAGDSNWAKARQAFDLRFTYTPKAVVVK
jgi:hypothetical protein